MKNEKLFLDLMYDKPNTYFVTFDLDPGDTMMTQIIFVSFAWKTAQMRHFF